MESKSKPKKIPLPPFRPYPPEIARELAKRVAEVCADTGHILMPGEMQCTLCRHPNREEIDFLILTHAPLKKRQEAFGEGGEKWKYSRFDQHRNVHLLPTIKAEVVPSITQLRMLPHPHGGTEQERGRWYFQQTYGIFLAALDKESPTRALSALKDMRELDFGILNQPVEKPAEKVAEVIQIEPPKQDRSRLFGAFERSKVKQAEDYELPRDEDEDAET